MAGKKSTSRTPDVGPNKGGFVFGETEPGNQPNKILNLDKVDCFIAAYTDGESKKQVSWGTRSRMRCSARSQGAKENHLYPAGRAEDFGGTARGHGWIGRRMLGFF